MHESTIFFLVVALCTWSYDRIIGSLIISSSFILFFHGLWWYRPIETRSCVCTFAFSAIYTSACLSSPIFGRYTPLHSLIPFRAWNGYQRIFSLRNTFFLVNVSCTNTSSLFFLHSFNLIGITRNRNLILTTLFKIFLYEFLFVTFVKLQVLQHTLMVDHEHTHACNSIILY